MPDSADHLPLWLAFLSLREQATRDWLTGLYNRRFFEETFTDHVAAAKYAKNAEAFQAESVWHVENTPYPEASR